MHPKFLFMNYKNRTIGVVVKLSFTYIYIYIFEVCDQELMLKLWNIMWLLFIDALISFSKPLYLDWKTM